MTEKMYFPQYHQCVAVINRDPDALYVAVLDGEFYTMKGSQMKGFLMASDVLDEFWKF